MAKNLIPEIAKMLGVELGEEFQVRDTYNGKRIIEQRLFFIVLQGAFFKEDKYSPICRCPNILENLITGELEVVKLPWKPKFNEKYYTFCRVFRYREFDGWSIETYNWANTPMDVALLKTGWVYRTREEAEAALPKVAEELGVEYEV